MSHAHPLFVGNPLLGPSGIARRRRGATLRVWWVTLQIALICHAISHLLLAGIGSYRGELIEPFSLWISVAIAPYLGTFLIPLVACQLLPRSQDLRAMLVDLRLAGLTPTQIAVGHLARAGQALLRYQIIWILTFAALTAHPEVVERIRTQGRWNDDMTLLVALILGGLFDPWMMLGFAWAVFVITRRLLSAVMAVIPVALILNPFAIAWIGMAAFGLGQFDVDLITLLEVILLIVKAALALAALAWTARRFDRLLER